MGDWSEFFEDFPEEDPSNYIGNKFLPKGSAERVEQEKLIKLKVIPDPRENED